MLNNFKLLPALAIVSATAFAQPALLVPDFSSPSPTGLSITADRLDTGWVRVSGIWRDNGLDGGTKQYVAGEMGRAGGQQDSPLWFGQVISGNDAFTGNFNLVFDVSHRLVSNETIRVEVYGANTFSEFALDNDAGPAGWTLLNAGTEVTYLLDPSITDLASYNAASRTNETSIVAVDLGAGYEHLAVRFRTRTLSNNTGLKELAFTQVNFAAIPEPATVATLLGALVLLFAIRRRRA